MLNLYFSQLFLLFKRILPVYLLYSISRLLFYGFNQNAFQDLSVGELLSICLYGLRFDTFSVLTGNALFILLSILPLNAFNNGYYKKTLLWVYGICNSVFLIFNLVDIAYFPYIKKKIYGRYSETGRRTNRPYKTLTAVHHGFLVSATDSYCINVFPDQVLPENTRC